MHNILSLEEFISESKLNFTNQQINESFMMLNAKDEQLLEAWYNTLLDFVGLIPGIGSVAEGINLVSYAKQGEYLLAALRAIGLIPIFGQYVGAGGTLLIKALGRGATLGKGILTPLINLIAKFFPKIVGFFKSAKFASKFSGISPFIGKMLGALKEFVITGGAKLSNLAKDTAKIKQLKKEARLLKGGVKITKSLFGGKAKPEPTPVPKDVYSSYIGKDLKNIRPYSDMEITQAETAHDWAEAYLS